MYQLGNMVFQIIMFENKVRPHPPQNKIDSFISKLLNLNMQKKFIALLSKYYNDSAL